MITPSPTANAQDVTAKNGWKCNNCQTVFTSAQQERKPDDNNGGPVCPGCKAHGQYTYPFALHDGDPCTGCGVAHDDVAPGACKPAQDVTANPDAFDAVNAALDRVGEEGDDDRLTGEEAWDVLVNVDDRTSPEEYPDMCLITRDELIGFMGRASALSGGNA